MNTSKNETQLSNYRTTFVIGSMLVLTMAIFVFIAIWLYENRKVDYYMGSEENCEYSSNCTHKKLINQLMNSIQNIFHFIF